MDHMISSAVDCSSLAWYAIPASQSMASGLTCVSSGMPLFLLLFDDSVYRCFEGSVGDIVCVVHGFIPSLCCRRYRLGSIYCLRSLLG